MPTSVSCSLTDLIEWINHCWQSSYSIKSSNLSVGTVSILFGVEAGPTIYVIDHSFPPTARFCQIELINARVPLLKFRDIQNNINVDLNVHNIVGIRNTRLLKAYSDCDDRFPKLVLAVKRWAKSNDINSAHRKTLSSYSLALMVVHFLQGNFYVTCYSTFNSLHFNSLLSPSPSLSSSD